MDNTTFFTDIVPIQRIPRTPRKYNMDQIVVGDGGIKSMRVNREGLALGGRTWGTSPFRVDMEGNTVLNNLTANNATINNAVAYNLTITGNDPSKQYLRYVSPFTFPNGETGLRIQLPNADVWNLKGFKE